MQHGRQILAQAQRAVHDTFNSLKTVFEKHNVVLTIGASVASAGAAWAGYAARQIHQKKVEDRLNNLEHVMTNVHQMEEDQVRALVGQVGVSYKACAATAGTTLVIGPTKSCFWRSTINSLPTLNISRLESCCYVWDWFRSLHYKTHCPPTFEEELHLGSPLNIKRIMGPCSVWWWQWRDLNTRSEKSASVC